MMKYMPPPSTHKKWLDIGSGQGSWTLRLRSAGYEVTAVDLDNSQFAEAVKADMHELPFADYSVDGIFCTGSFEHAFAPFIVLHEFRRVLRDGGVIVLNLPTEDNVKMLEDAGHYCSLSRLQLEKMYCTKLGMTVTAYERGQWNEVYGPHQIFAISVKK